MHKLSKISRLTASQRTAAEARGCDAVTCCGSRSSPMTGRLVRQRQERNQRACESCFTTRCPSKSLLNGLGRSLERSQARTETKTPRKRRLMCSVG